VESAASGRPVVRFNILGSLEGWCGERRLRLGSPTQERVLVTLLLEPGRMVPMSRLIAAAWDDEPPQTASHQIRKCVAALRTRIPDGAALIITDGAGYRAMLGEHQLDLHEFTEWSRQARQAVAAGRPEDAVGHLRACLDLWRGPVMAGAGGSVISAASAALEERHMAVAEQYFELQLELGQSGDLVGPLRELVTAHPLRETLRGRLMLALYRAGRQAEALEEFGRVRDLLVEELGIDPGAELTRLYEAILRDSPEVAPRLPQSVSDRAALLVPAPYTTQPSGTEPAPCTLPYDLPDFTGRDDELARLVTVGRAPAGGGARIVGVDGMGGSGKTALAVHAAHLLAPDYPDGQLFVDLRGFSPGEKAQDPGAVLHSLLHTLGIPDDRIPDDLERRITFWRTVSAQRKLLLLLDNAADAAQVRPLLPASENCLAILTSRVRMLDLDGSEWLSLGLLSAGDSTTLLTRMLGTGRTAAEPQAVDQLARLCGGLPLALRITTARLRNRPRWTVQYLVDRLADETRRLRELSAGERSVEATLRLSYQAMDEDQRGAFRLLGLHPGSAIDVHSAAALLATDGRDAEDILEGLLDAHLLEQHEAGLYGFHDLVRTYALSVREVEDDEEAAAERLVAYYIQATDLACETLFPGRTRYGDAPADLADLPRLDDGEQALRWFDREYEALLAVVARAGTQGLHRPAALLARNLLFYLDLRGRYEEFRVVGRIGVAACRQLDDPALLGISLCNLAVAHWWLGDFQDGITTAQEGLEHSSGSDPRSEAMCLDVLGLLHGSLGNFEQARSYLDQGIALHRELGLSRMEAQALVNLSTVQIWTGHYAEGARNAARATELNRRLGERSNEIHSLTFLALAHLGTGEDERARACLAQVLELCDESRKPANVAVVLAHWARVCQRLGDVRSAAEHAERALDLVSAEGTALRQATVSNVVGLVHLRSGAPDRAMELHGQAHELASRHGYRIEIAHALHGMAEAAQALDDEKTAELHHAQAKALYDAMGVTEAGRRL